jgi:tetratricopeptide (TPR) repeat protein
MDPDIVISTNNLCHTLIKQGAYEEADRLAQASIELEEKITGEKLNSCTDALLKVRSQCRAAAGAWEDAVQFAQQAISCAETIYGPNHRFTNDKRALLARTQIQAGQLDAAAETLQAARAAGWGESAEHSLEVSQALWWLAKGEGHEAELAAQRAVAHYRQQMKVPTIEIVDALHVLAQAYVAQGKPESAREALNEGLQILRPNLNPKMPMVLELQTLLSRLPTVGNH